MGNFNILPRDIMLEILTRLPTETVLLCKSVCKTWKDLVSHPSFSQVHLKHLNQAADYGKLSFLVVDDQKLHYFQYNEKHDETPIDSVRMINLTPPLTSYYFVAGSCNGLVCLYGHPDPTPYICNPVTREYVMLPEIMKDWKDHYYYYSCGFGYIPLTNEYKVVQLYKPRGRHDDYTLEVVVYTLGSGNGWRNVGRLDSVIPQGLSGKFTNGFLYWKEAHGVYKYGPLHELYEEGGRFFVFDLAEEKFLNHVSPPPSSRDAYFGLDSYYLGVFDGVLYYAIKEYDDITECKCSLICTCFSIWLLKGKNDNGDMKELGWSKELHLLKGKNDNGDMKELGWSKELHLPVKKALATIKNGGVLCYDWSLDIYDAIASTSKTLVNFNFLTEILPHKITLVSLKEIGEKDVKVMETARREGRKTSWGDEVNSNGSSSARGDKKNTGVKVLQKSKDTHHTYIVYYYGEEIKTTVTHRASVVDQWLEHISKDFDSRLSNLVVGLDIEWRRLSRNNMDARKKVAVLQLCVDNHCLIYQFSCCDKTAPESLKNFLGDDEHIFVGAGIEADAYKLMVDYGLKVARTEDLASLAAFKHSNSRLYKTGLKKLVKDVLKQDLPKSRLVQTSDWERNLLSNQQIEYACLDVVASFKLGVQLMSLANPRHTYQKNNDRQKKVPPRLRKSNGGKIN